MKLNKIWFLFVLSLIANIGFRFLQLYFTIDAKTGFYIEKSENYGQILLILIMLCGLIIGVFSYLVFKTPENPPKGNIYLSAVSVVLGLFVFTETFFLKNSLQIFGWQTPLLKLLGIALTGFLILFSISPYLKIKLHPTLTIIPVGYMIMRTIYDFTSISKLALISDNILLIAVYCVTLIFLLNFAKLYNNLADDRTFKRILSYGLTSTIMCFTFSIPNIFINILTNNSYQHTSTSTNIFILLLGIFILTFLCSYFSKKNMV